MGLGRRGLQGKFPQAAVRPPRHGPQLARRIGKIEQRLKPLHRLLSQALSIQEQLHGRAVGVDLTAAELSLKARPGPAADGLLGAPDAAIDPVTVVGRLLDGDVGLLAQAKDNLPEVAHRAAIADEVDVAAVGQVARPRRAELRAAVVGGHADACLADVVPAGPGVVAQELGIFLDQCPVEVDFRRKRL